MPKPTTSEAIGFIASFIGIAGIAGWTETGKGLLLASVLLVIGVFLLYRDGVWHK